MTSPDSDPPPEPTLFAETVEEDVPTVIPTTDDDVPVVVPVAESTELVPVVVPLSRTGNHDEVDDVPTVIAASRPGPSVWAALGWSVLFLVFQLAGSLAILAVMVLAIMVISGFNPTQGREIQPELGEQLTNFLEEGPGFVLLLLGATTLTVIFASVLTLLFHGTSSRRTVALRGIHPLHALAVLMLVPPGYVVVIAIHNMADPYLPSFEQARGLEDTVLNTWWPIVVLAGCVMPALGEELFCRAFLGRGLVARNGILHGTILTSLLFGMLHVDPVQVCYTIVLGITLHFVYLTTKTLLAPVLLHFLHNLLAFSAARLSYAFPDSIWGSLREGGEITPALLATSFVAEFALFLFLYQTRTRWILPDGKDWSPGYVTAEMPPTFLHATAKVRWASWYSWLLLLAAYGAFGWMFAGLFVTK